MHLPLLCLLVVAAQPPESATRSSGAGLVIESVVPGSIAARAGFREGDVLTSWWRGPRRPDAAPGQALDSPFELALVQIEHAPRGGVMVSGTRDGAPLTLALSPERTWVVRPELGPGALRPYLEGLKLERAGAIERAVERWTAARQALAGDSRRECWLLMRMGDAWKKRSRWVEAQEAYQAALEKADGAWRPVISMAAASALRGQRGSARPLELLRAAEAEARRSPESLLLAELLYELSLSARAAGDPAAGRTHLGESLAIREKLAPGSLPVAMALIQLGGEEGARRALEICERVAPDSPWAASALNALGGAAHDRGDLPLARRYWLRELEIAERVHLEDAVVVSDINLSAVTGSQGDTATTEALLRRALSIVERSDPNGGAHGVILNNLGEVAIGRNDLESAERLFRQSLAIFERLTPPGHRFRLGAQLNLAEVLYERQDGAGARALLEPLIVSLERDPDHVREAEQALALRARWAMQEGRWEEAEVSARRALALANRRAPGSLDAAVSLHLLGAVQRRQGHLRAARDLLRQALDLRHRLAPASAPEAETLHELALVTLQEGRTAPAAAQLVQALDTLESQGERLGRVPNLAVAFRTRHARMYLDAIDVLNRLDRDEEAFQALERFKARSFLSLLAERDIALPGEVPAELDRQRRSNEREMDQALEGAATADQRPAQLQALEETAATLRRKILSAAPRLAELRGPQPLTARQAAASLDDGTVMLSYSVDAEKSLLFVLGGGALQAYPIDAGERVLGARIERFRSLAERSAPPPQFFDEARALFDLLVGPAWGRLATAHRVLICPDGPLHALPFGALRRQGRFLVEWLPLHFIQSATVYDQLVHTRGGASYARELVAFGGSGDLPGSRREVEQLAGLFSNGEARFGAAATEEAATGIGPGVRRVHFAVHGLVDHRSPLSSALMLSPTDRDSIVSSPGDGRLEVWEIFERMRLDADLVTLAACDAAGGLVLRGEGIIGLTRAFQYAGARSVAAPLWSMGDRSAGALMLDYYRLLEAGTPKDEALRRAQVTAIQAGQHPIRWAALQLYGDWR